MYISKLLISIPTVYKPFILSFTIQVIQSVKISCRKVSKADVDMKQLAEKLGMNTVYGNNYIKMLQCWKTEVHNPDYNCRTKLADAVHELKFEPLALNILSGTYSRTLFM